MWPDRKRDEQRRQLGRGFPWPQLVGMPQRCKKLLVDFIEVEFRQREIRPQERRCRTLLQGLTKLRVRVTRRGQRLLRASGAAHPGEIHCAEAFKRPRVGGCKAKAVREIFEDAVDFLRAGRSRCKRPAFNVVIREPGQYARCAQPDGLHRRQRKNQEKGDAAGFDPPVRGQVKMCAHRSTRRRSS